MGEFSTRVDMTGTRFGRLIAIECVGRRQGSTYWRFRCDCGRIKDICGTNVRQGNTTSCGCAQKEAARAANTTHGKSKTVEYRTWHQMIKRCENPSDPAYGNYGGRGIKVCMRWRNSFETFFADMGPRPSSSHTIERLDNDAGYSPQNCAWIERCEQNQNRRGVRRYTFRGSHLTIRQLSEQYDIPVKSLTRRIEAGWTINRAVLEPLAPKGKRASPTWRAKS